MYTKIALFIIYINMVAFINYGVIWEAEKRVEKINRFISSGMGNGEIFLLVKKINNLC